MGRSFFFFNLIFNLFNLKITCTVFWLHVRQMVVAGGTRTQVLWRSRQRSPNRRSLSPALGLFVFSLPNSMHVA